jgi:hypothetical protein
MSPLLHGGKLALAMGGSPVKDSMGVDIEPEDSSKVLLNGVASCGDMDTQSQ